MADRTTDHPDGFEYTEPTRDRDGLLGARLGAGHEWKAEPDPEVSGYWGWRCTCGGEGRDYPTEVAALLSAERSHRHDR